MNGRPGRILVSPDATRIFVLDDENPWITVLSLPNLRVLRWIDLEPYREDPRFFLAMHRETVFCRGRSAAILHLDVVAERFQSALRCGGLPRDLDVLPHGYRAQVTVSSGNAGSVELIRTDRSQILARLDLPGTPVEGTLAASPDGSLGAVALVLGGQEATGIACWALDPLRLLFVSPVGRGARSVAFDPEGRFLYAACHGDSEVVEIVAGSGKTTQRLRMAGRPFQIRMESRGRMAWALCESLGSLAIVDAARGAVTASLPLRGVRDPGSRLAFSPEGKLAVVPAEDGVALLNADPAGGRYGQSEDLLELGQCGAHAAWSPLGDEIFLSCPETGVVLALGVERGDVSMDDTSQCLNMDAWKSSRSGGGKPFSPNPLFPP